MQPPNAKPFALALDPPYAAPGPSALELGQRVRFLDPILSHDPRQRRPAGELGTVSAIYPLDDTEYRIDLDSGGTVLRPITALAGIEVL
jgi:hypothetical protein